MRQIDTDTVQWLRGVLESNPDIRSVEPVSGEPSNLLCLTTSGVVFEVTVNAGRDLERVQHGRARRFEQRLAREHARASNA